MDIISSVSAATGVGASLGIVIRLFGAIFGFLGKREEEKSKRDALLTGKISEYSKIVDSATVELREVDNSYDLSWKLLGVTLFSRKFIQKGKKPIFTLRQHAISFTIYCFVSVYSFCAVMLICQPSQNIKTIPPTDMDRQVSWLWGLYTKDIPAGVAETLSTVGIGWDMLSVMAGVITMLVVGVAGTNHKSR